MSVTATIIPADPALWRQGFLDLRSSVVPCPGFTAATWSGVHAKSTDFLDRWADEAAALGWTTLELFGVHSKIGTVRPDYCGALVMSGELVSAITEQRMQFTNTTFYRDTPGRPTGAVPLWRFGR